MVIDASVKMDGMERIAVTTLMIVNLTHVCMKEHVL